jgi:hypothetical protein
MYSKKNIINRQREGNNNRENKINSKDSAKKIYKKNYLTYREENNKFFNYDYLKDHLKKNKNNMNKFYIKKTLKLLNNHEKNPNKDIKNNNYQTITQERIKKKKNLIYTLNPQNSNSNSQSKINQFDYSANLSKENIAENINNFNYNISGYNTINNVGIEIKLDNNTCSSIPSNKIQETINYGINRYNHIAKPEKNYFNMYNRINTKRENLRKSYLHKSTPDLNKFLNLINDNSRDNTYLETYSDKHKLTINSKTNTTNFYLDNRSQSMINDKNSIKRKRTRSNRYDPFKIRKELEYRKNEFEKMRKIEKKIKKYFNDNGVSIKNRELYHQSGIIIQSNFRTFLTRKNVKILLKFKGIMDILNKIFNEKKSSYFRILLDNINIFKNKLDIEDTNPIKTEKINNKNRNLKIEMLNNFSIININNSNIKLNEKLEEENKSLKIKLNELETQINKLKKENEIDKKKFINNSVLSENKIDIIKMKENIENVSKELEEMKTSKKKNENKNMAYNLKSYINVNNKNFRRPNTISRFFDMNEKSSQEIKYLYLKYLITLRIIKANECKKFIFYKFITNTKFEKLNEIIQIYKIKQMMNIIKNKLNKNVYLFFYQMHYIYLNTKFQKPLLYVKNKFIKSIKDDKDI